MKCQRGNENFGLHSHAGGCAIFSHNDVHTSCVSGAKDTHNASTAR